MVKILLLQKLYNRFDIQSEREIRSRKPSLNFLGYREKLPDRNVIWYFRERWSKIGNDRLVFNEVKDRVMSKRIRIKKGTMQEVSFIEEDKGEYGKPRGIMQISADTGTVHQQQKTMRNISATSHIPF